MIGLRHLAHPPETVAGFNPILAGESKEADSASSVSRFFVKKQSKEADSASFGCSIFFQIFFFENR